MCVEILITLNFISFKHADKLKKNKLAGSIVIVCASKADVKHVSGSLTQANIKCIELDEQYSRNQMSKCYAKEPLNIKLKLKTERKIHK